MNVCLVALGKIGLPLAVQCALKGHQVIGADVNADVVDLVNAATEPFPGETHLAEHLANVVVAGRLTATTQDGGRRCCVRCGGRRRAAHGR